MATDAGVIAHAISQAAESITIAVSQAGEAVAQAIRDMPPPVYVVNSFDPARPGPFDAQHREGDEGGVARWLDSRD